MGSASKMADQVVRKRKRKHSRRIFPRQRPRSSRPTRRSTFCYRSQIVDGLHQHRTKDSTRPSEPRPLPLCPSCDPALLLCSRVPMHHHFPPQNLRILPAIRAAAAFPRMVQRRGVQAVGRADRRRRHHLRSRPRLAAPRRQRRLPGLLPGVASPAHSDYSPAHSDYSPADSDYPTAPL